MSDKASPRVEGRWAGATTGTGFLGLVALIPEQYAAVRNVLVYSAPSVSILVGWGWAYGRAKFLRKLNDKELSDAIERATIVRDHILADPNSTQEMKDNAVGAVNDLQELRIAAIREHYDAVKADMGKVV